MPGQLIEEAATGTPFYPSILPQRSGMRLPLCVWSPLPAHVGPSAGRSGGRRRLLVKCRRAWISAVQPLVGFRDLAMGGTVMW
jgi:hypothetical protein